MLLSSDQNESIDEIHISKKYVCFWLIKGILTANSFGTGYFSTSKAGAGVTIIALGEGLSNGDLLSLEMACCNKITIRLIHMQLKDLSKSS